MKEKDCLELSSSHLQLEQSDVDTLVNAFNQPTVLRKKGIYFNEVYYACIRADNESIYAKEVSVVLLVSLDIVTHEYIS